MFAQHLQSFHVQAKNYRPIILSPFNLKMLDKILDIYICKKIEGMKAKVQHAFTKGNSTETALHKVQRQVKATLLPKQYTIAFLNIE